ncbi:uncharacterized protein LOC119668835 [Teleopsis dalmanni]|uniref:uncharacterized protein LOC119668708 n=1 Tax=Teleopsis dalmanni TaxID=139649 RepID=UPI0018CE42C5|nr:uncharacterized protein LOC119668708 [Teleopsis dalmanni]XP_037934412.1 uncharacterized protein LOC119668835 [Teleopsis dalmanni]
MLVTAKSVAAKWRAFVDILMAPVSPKNLRLSAILIGIYQLLVAHILLFLLLLGLANAEQMKTMLAMDIEDQKDNGFYDMSPFSNQLRLQTASELVSVTETFLYILTAVAAVYLLSTISLFAGIFNNRSEFVLPWLVVEFIFIVSATVLVFLLQNGKFVEFIGGKIMYFTICFAVLVFDSLMWYIVHSFYQSLRTMNKLREIATVAIPCPPPGAIPFRRENMYLGSNGYKHILTENPDGNY